MALLDLLGRRWTLRIVWELREGPSTFRELQERCDAMSSSVLNQRLRELRDAEIVTLKDGSGYALTTDGHSLLEALSPLQSWATAWSERA